MAYGGGDEILAMPLLVSTESETINPHHSKLKPAATQYHFGGSARWVANVQC
jgi:hypothetical protein